LITRTAPCLRQLPSCVAVYPRDSRSRRVLCHSSHSFHSLTGDVFYVAHPISSIETRSLPTLTRSYPRRFTLITRTAPCLRQLPWLRCRLPARLKLVCFPRFDSCAPAHFRPLGLPIYVARVPATPFSPLPIAALPSMSLPPKAPFPRSRRVLCPPRRSLGVGGSFIPFPPFFASTATRRICRTRQLSSSCNRQSCFALSGQRAVPQVDNSICR
jgi:hypothetical protein